MREPPLRGVALCGHEGMAPSCSPSNGSGHVEPTPVPAWVYSGMVAGPLSLVSLLRVSGTQWVRSLSYRPWSLLRPYAWTVFWLVVAIIVGVVAYFGQG